MADFSPHETAIHNVQALPVPVPTKLVGRDAALAQIYGQLKENNPVLLYGPAGAGKTAMAATLAGAYTQQSGGVLWLPVDNPRLEDLLVRVGRAYQVNEIITSDNPVSMIAAVENTLRSHKPLVVLDGLIQPDVANRFISRCVSGVPLVVTNDTKIDGPWAALGVSPLEAEQAAVLFKQEARLTTSEHDMDVYGVTKVLGNMPIGIVIAARSMVANKLTPTQLLATLKPLAQSAGSVNPVFALTFAFSKLNNALQGLVLMMGASFNGQASAELLANVSGAPLDSVKQAMKILTQLHLVRTTDRYGDPYYTMHRLTHQFAQAGLKRSNKLDSLREKFRNMTMQYAQKYQAGTKEIFDKLATEMENFMAAASWSADHGQNDRVDELVVLLSQAGDFIQARGYVYELLQMRALTGSAQAFPAYPPEEMPPPEVNVLDVEDDESNEYEIDEDALEEVEDAEYASKMQRTQPPPPEDDVIEADVQEVDTEAEIDEDDEAIAVPDFLSSIESDTETLFAQTTTEAPLPLGDVNALKNDLAAAKQAGDDQLQLRILNAIGNAQVEQGMENEAIATYNEILNLHEQSGDQSGELETLDMLAALMAKTENSQAAVMNATRGAKLAETLGERETRMHLLTTLGDARQQLGESDAAARDYTDALSIARQSDDTQNEAIILYKLGYAQLDSGDADTAIHTWEQALELFRTQGKREYEGRVLGGLGNAYGDLDRWSEALNYHTSALHIARELNDKEDEALQLSSLAYAAYQAEQLGEAVMRYRQALHLAYEQEDRENIIGTIVDLSRLLMQSRPHVPIAELLINDALRYDTGDKDIEQLVERLESEKNLAEAYGVKLKKVNGTARDYAANAYQVLEA